MAKLPFWQRKTLDEMSRAEWEALCDGCARCCLVKLEDEETGEVAYTDVACGLLDIATCRCADYANRATRVEDCLPLSADNVAALGWLPQTCAYRLIAEGRPLYWWHPLVSGRADTVHEAGVSVTGFARPEKGIGVQELEDFIRPLPRAARKRPKRRRTMA